jgi:hypothetical protein
MPATMYTQEVAPVIFAAPSVPTVPSFDDALVKALAVTLGPIGITIGALFALASNLLSWPGAAKTGMEIGRKVVARTRSVSLPAHPGAVSGVLPVVAAAQLLAVGMCFLVGNYLSMAFDNQRLREAAAVIGADPWHVWEPSHWGRFIRVDGFSVGYALLAIVVMLASYGSDGTGGKWNAGTALAFPGVALLGGAALAGIYIGLITIFVLLISILPGGHAGEYFAQLLPAIEPLLLGTAVCAIFVGGCTLAVRGARLVRRVWRSTA